METRANFVLIGGFALAGFLGLLGFFLWFAQVELDRQFAYYDIRFSSVAGLSNASDVRFAGLPVGQVVSVRLAPNRDGTVLVRVEVDAETPVRADSVATIEAQGVTGVSYVGIDPGSPEAPLLEADPGAPVPEIAAGRSTLQSLSEDAPRLLENALAVIEEMSEVFDAENKARVNTILRNVETASGEFATALEDFAAVTGSVSEFADQIAMFNDTLETLSGDLTGVLTTAEGALTSITDLSEQGKGVLGEISRTLTGAQSAIARTERFIDEDLTRTTGALHREITRLGDSAETVLVTLRETGQTATARLEEAQATIAAADALIARLDGAALAVGDTATRVGALVEEEGRPLLADTRALVAEAGKAVTTVGEIVDRDLPVVVADIRAATAAFNRTVADVGDSLTASGAGVDALITSARATLEDATLAFNNANVTLAAIDAAMVSAEETLAVAERAFAGADRLLSEEVGGIVAGLETTLDSLQEAIARVSADIPGITADLRAASRAATATFAEIRGVTGAAAPAVQEFTTATLPLFARLAQESRALIGNLDRLTTQFQRDPARFLLDRDTPEFRR